MFKIILQPFPFVHTQAPLPPANSGNATPLVSNFTFVPPRYILICYFSVENCLTFKVSLFYFCVCSTVYYILDNIYLCFCISIYIILKPYYLLTSIGRIVTHSACNATGVGRLFPWAMVRGK
jgi:hypothetical protein